VPVVRVIGLANSERLSGSQASRTVSSARSITRAFGRPAPAGGRARPRSASHSCSSHRLHSLLAVRHSSDERNLTDVTGSYKVSRGYWGGAVDSTPPWRRRSGCCACPGWWPSPAERWSKPGRRWPEPADLNTAPRNPGGCLMVQGALAREEASDSIRQELAACRSAAMPRYASASNVRNQKLICRPHRSRHSRPLHRHGHLRNRSPGSGRRKPRATDRPPNTARFCANSRAFGRLEWTAMASDRAMLCRSPHRTAPSYARA